MNKNYIPLYRKYRPQKIEEIVGQEHIKKALSNAIESDRVSHAYLFTGPRGTGKTSTARIFAKSLNCEKGPTVSPCNECENCKNITNAIPIDVIEIDAASNRSVSDAEEIIQNVAMSPVHSRYKIYIIDEVHMLTTTAFNALLKTLEEPPANVIFILATTEVHKVLDTIKSRCQRFDFKRITTDDISKHLRYISDKEGINIEDDALTYIAQNSAGGMRDSIALLDQLSVLSSSEDKISVDDINRILGRLSFESLSALFGAIVSSNQNEALNKLNDIYNSGNEPSQILSNLLEYMRNALIIKSLEAKNSTDVVSLNKEQIKKLEKLTENIEVHQLVALIDKCANYTKELKLTSEPKLWLDVAILDMSNLAENTKLTDLQKRIEMLEAGTSHKMVNVSAYNTPPSPVLKSEIKAQPQMKEIIKTEEKPEKFIKPEKQSVSEVKEKEQELIEVPMSSSSDNIKTLWVSFLDNISSFPSRAILKQQAVPVKMSKQEIVIVIKNETWLKNFSPDGERYAYLVESAKKVFDSEPKVIVRGPKSGDEKLDMDTESVVETSQKDSPRQLIEQTPSPTKEDIDDALSAEDDLSEQANDEQKSTSYKTISRADSAYHSDNVNMVMDLFEGKLIE